MVDEKKKVQTEKKGEEKPKKGDEKMSEGKKKVKVEKKGQDVEKKNQEVEKKVKKQKKVEQFEIPDPTISVNGVKNPLFNNGRYKQTMCVALACEIIEAGGKPEEHLEKLSEILRNIGVVRKLGFTEENIHTEELSAYERSGRNYAKQCCVNYYYKKKYHEKYPLKIAFCAPFAHAALKQWLPEVVLSEKDFAKYMESYNTMKKKLEEEKKAEEENNKDEDKKVEKDEG